MNTQRTNPRVFRVTTLLQQRKLPRSRSKLSRYIAERCGDAFERREREIVTAVEEFEERYWWKARIEIGYGQDCYGSKVVRSTSHA